MRNAHYEIDNNDEYDQYGQAVFPFLSGGDGVGLTSSFSNCFDDHPVHDKENQDWNNVMAGNNKRRHKYVDDFIFSPIGSR